MARKPRPPVSQRRKNLSPICTCDRCGDFFAHDERLSLLALVDGRIVEVAWLCWVCGLREGGIPERALPVVEALIAGEPIPDSTPPFFPKP